MRITQHIAARLPGATDPGATDTGGFLNLDPIKDDLNTIITVLILAVGAFLIFQAFRGKFGKVFGIAGIVLAGLLVAGLATKTGNASPLSDKFWSMLGVS